MCKYIHVHFRAFRKEDIPKDIEQLDQWLRDLWTEKEQILQKMKDGKIEHTEMDRMRGCWECSQRYAFFAMLSAFMVVNVLCGVSLWSCTTLIAVICVLLPIGVVVMERSQEFYVDNANFKRKGK